VDLVALFEQELGKIGPILTGDPGYKRAFHFITPFITFIGFNRLER
jgi:hypothetical protein